MLAVSRNFENNPPYTGRPPHDTNQYHSGYDQPPSQMTHLGGFIATPPGAMALQQAAPEPCMSSSTVVIVNQPQPTVLTGRTRGRDLTIPAVLVCFFCCLCTGIPAIIYARKAQNEYDAENWEEARANQSSARFWTICSVLSHIGLWVAFVIMYYVVLAIAAS